MEFKKIKCSSKDDQEIDAISYCGECKINMCNKCEKYHTKLFQNHHIYNLNKNIEDIFTGFCKELNHSERLDFFVRIIIHYVVLLVCAKFPKKDLDFIKIVMFV